MLRHCGLLSALCRAFGPKRLAPALLLRQPVSTRNKVRFDYALIAACSVAIASACGGTADTTDLDPNSELSQVELEYGGFDEADEAPMFGDETFGLLAEEAEDPVEDDGTNEDGTPMRPEAPEADRPDPSTVRHARISFTAVWGKLRPDPNVTRRTDWTGGLVARGAAIGQVRTIRFERNDHLLPRQSRDAVRWVSVTGPHHDGISTVIHVPVTLNSAGGVVSTGGAVRLQTAPFAITIPLRDLADYRQVFRVGDNAVAINAFLIRPNDCPTGQMRGRWSPANDDGVGHFIGRWMSDDGRLHGHLRGRYGVRANGDQVWAAKIIGPGGNFIGRMRGTWDAGQYQGRYVTRNGGHGSVRGRYANDPNNPGGVFMGRWAKHCTDRPTTMPEAPEEGTRPERPTPEDGTTRPERPSGS